MDVETSGRQGDGEGPAAAGARRRAAFEREVRAQRDRLVRLARRYAPPGEAEDAAQDGLVQALAGLDGFGERAKLGTWLHQIVVNAALMRGRRRQVVAKRETPTVKGAVSLVDLAADARASASQLLEREEERARLRRAIAALPARYRGPVELTLVAERTAEETAAALGITANAVRTRLSRARFRLAEVLAAA